MGVRIFALTNWSCEEFFRLRMWGRLPGPSLSEPLSIYGSSCCLQSSICAISWRSILNLNSSISTLSQSPSSSLSSQRAAFSTSKTDKPQTPPSPGSPSSGNPSYPAFSFEGLDANRTIKATVIACLTVVGTIESIFWAKVLWAKMSKSSEEKGEPEGT